MPNYTPTNITPNWAGEFTSYQQWVNKGKSWLASPDNRRAVCIDDKGRRVTCGGDFALARDEDAFPVRFFWDCEPQEAAPAVANAENSDALPPLPEPTIEGTVMHPELKICYLAPVHFTADQMQAYAHAAIAHAAPNAQLVDALKIGMECATDLLSDAPRSRVMEISGRIDTIRAALKDAGIK